MGKAREAKRREENEIEFSRIVAFSDGVFAIAITLLVLNLGVGEGGDYGGTTAAEVLYAGNLVGVVLSGTLLFADAQRAGLTRTDSAEAREGRRHALLTALVFAASIPVALVNPDLAPYCWLVLFIVPMASRLAGKRRP